MDGNKSDGPEFRKFVLQVDDWESTYYVHKFDGDGGDINSIDDFDQVITQPWLGDSHTNSLVFTSDLEPIFVESLPLLSVAIEATAQGTYNTIDGDDNFHDMSVRFSQNDHDGDGFISLRLTAGNLADDLR